MLTMNDSKIQQRYLEYKAVQEEKHRKEAEANQLIQQQKAANNATWQAKAAQAYKTVTTYKPHKCSTCNQTIPAGTKATVHATFGNNSQHGYTPGFHSEYHCQTCRPIQEEKQTPKTTKKITHGPYRCNLPEGKLPDNTLTPGSPKERKCFYYHQSTAIISGIIVENIPLCRGSCRKCPMLGPSIVEA